jgi:hypothetical protein
MIQVPHCRRGTDIPTIRYGMHFDALYGGSSSDHHAICHKGGWGDERQVEKFKLEATIGNWLSESQFFRPLLHRFQAECDVRVEIDAQLLSALNHVSPVDASGKGLVF